MRPLTRLLPLLAACAAAAGCGESKDVPAADQTSGGAGAGGAAQPSAGGSGGASGGSGGTSAGSSGTTGGDGGVSAGAGGDGGVSAGAGGSAGSSAGETGGAGSGGSSAGAGGADPSAGIGGGAGAAGQAGASGSAGGGGAPLPPFSFFVASMEGMQRLSGSPDGFGGNLRYGEADGLSGADKICTELAESSLEGSAAKQWRAFLSVTDGPNGEPVNAIDRVGPGPWYDRLGRVVASSLADLRNWRPRTADPLIINDLPNEFGVPNSNPNGTGLVDNHHVLTGSDTMGRLEATSRGDTCNDWTSDVATTGRPQCGFSWPRGGASSAPSGDGHWISGFRANGCAAGISIIQNGAGNPNIRTVGEGGGYGAIYCFALTP